MPAAYFDCFSGVAGDMFVGALIDLGADEASIRAEVAKVPLPPYEIKIDRVTRKGLAAVRFDVSVEDEKTRTWQEIRKLIEGTELAKGVKARVLAVFRRLAEAEAKVHGKSLEEVHFHEVGAADAIIDVVAACTGLELLGIVEATASPVATGSGFAQTAHGPLPIPAPAAAELLAGAPIYAGNERAELATPTGAALLTTTATAFGGMPALRLQKIGYGAGKRELATPNLFRIFLGEKVEAAADVVLVEANIDSVDAETLAFLTERLFSAGALDAWLMPIQMKKGRPGTTVSALASPGNEERLGALLIQEGATLGARFTRHQRLVADREIVVLESEWGPVSIKVARQSGRIISVRPEFEDCRRIAIANNLPLARVRERLIEAARRSFDSV